MLTQSRAGQLLGVSGEAIRRRIERGTLDAVWVEKDEGRVYGLVRRADVEAEIARKSTRAR